MNVEITNSGGCIVFGFDDEYIAINKQTIRNITIIGKDKVCIDTGKGTLELMYIAVTDVIKPTDIDTAALLLKTLKDMIGTSSSSNQDLSTQIAILQQLLLQAVPTSQTVSQILASPLLTDSTQPGILFEGYAPVGTSPGDTGWAIKVTRDKNGTPEVVWANGRATFINVWDDRYDLTYRLASALNASTAGGHG